MVKAISALFLISALASFSVATPLQPRRAAAPLILNDSLDVDVTPLGKCSPSFNGVSTLGEILNNREVFRVTANIVLKMVKNSSPSDQVCGACVSLTKGGRQVHALVVDESEKFGAFEAPQKLLDALKVESGVGVEVSIVNPTVCHAPAKEANTPVTDLENNESGRKKFLGIF